MHEGWHLDYQFLLLYFLYNVKVVFYLLLLYHFFVVLRDFEFEMVAEVFIEDFIKAEDEDGIRVVRI